MTARVTDLQEYLDQRSIPEPNSGCWIWLGAVTDNGYGVTSPLYALGNKASVAHRLSYRLNRMAIPVDKQLDHLCRNRLCINPDHLEVVTQRENVLRGIGPTAINAAKTECSHGHSFSVENTFWRGTTRVCRKCKYLDNKVRRLARQKQRQLKKDH